jgi:PAS domain S-box-containing protein
MAEKLEMKVRNLEHLLKLKSTILKATKIDKLLTDVCNTITQFQVYDVSWAVLLDEDNNAIGKYSSHKALSTKVEYLCWRDTLDTDKVLVHPRNSRRCKDCVLSNNAEATMLSKRLEYNGDIYGVFSVSIKNCLLDDAVEKQFVDLTDDISTMIHSIKLKEKNERYRKELAESQHMYRKLLDTSAIPVGIMDLESNVTFMTNSLKKILGYAEDDNSFIEQGLKGADFVSDEDRLRVKESLGQVLNKNIINTNDYVFKRTDGERIHMRLRTSLMHNAEGKPSGFMVIFHDLSTELKTAEDLQISEEKFRLLFMKAPNGVSFLSPTGVILDCNDQDAKMLQMERSELIGRHVKDFLSLEDQKAFKKNFESFKKDGTKSILVRLQRKDGEMISVARNVSALSNSDGSLRGIIVHSRDVTEDIKVQEQIDLLMLAIEQSSSVFTITDLDGNITYVNKRFSEVTGYTLDEAIGQNPKILKSGKLAEVVYTEMWEQLKNGGVWKGELCNKRKNGELYWEYASMTAIRNSKGVLTNYLKVAEDITQRRKAEQELKETTVRYHNIFNLVPNPIVIHIDGYIVDANQAAFLFSKGKNMRQLMGKDVMTFVHESSRELIANRIKKLREKGGDVPVTDAVFVNLHGESRDVRSLSKEVSFRGQRAFMVIFEDVTEHRIAERKVLENEKKFRDIFNLHPDPVSIADMDTGEMYEVNDSFLKIVRMKRKDVIGKSSLDIELYDNVEVRSKLIDRIKLNGQVKNHEVSFNIKGEQLTALVSGAIFGGEDSSKVLFVARDISKMKKAEQELRELNVRYRNIFNMAPNPIIVHVDGHIVDVNRAALLFAGAKNRNELLGKGIMSFVHESSQKEILNQIRVLNRGAKIPPFDAMFLTLKGEKRNVRTASNIISFGGKQAFMVFFEDITERKRAEQRLIESEKRFRQFFNLIPDPVIITNVKTRMFIESNNASIMLTGLSHKELAGASVLDYGLFKEPGQRDQLVNMVVEGEGVLNEEIDLVINDKVYTMLVSASVIEPVEEQNVLWIAHDISNRKAMEQDLVQAKERAEANEKLKSSFLSNISHEIRTPMNAILGFSDLLRDPEVEEGPRNQYINIIQQRGKDLLKMISDIMDISKIETGSLKLQNRAVRIHSIISETIDAANEQLRKTPTKDIVIVQNCKIDASQLVNGDKYRIRQVLSNLMDNAIKFTQKGTITISCWLDGEDVYFEIKDTGCGIAKDKIDQAFERFVQVHEIKDVTIGGSGLGLSISRSLLKLMGGEIWIKSDLGKGSTLSFKLKVFDGGDVPLIKSAPKSELTFDWSDKTILIAEDEPSNQMFVKVILNKTGINIIMANDGQEAVDLFEANKDIIDLVLLDIKMPELNGYEVTKHIKNISPNITIIALTANAMNNDREEALRSGCDDYLSKPIAKELLYSTIEKYI